MSEVAQGFDWGGLAEQFGLLEYGVESLGDRLDAARGLPQVAESPALQDILVTGFGGHLAFLEKVLARVDSKLKDAFDLLARSPLTWEEYKGVAGGGIPYRPEGDDGD